MDGSAPRAARGAAARPPRRRLVRRRLWRSRRLVRRGGTLVVFGLSSVSTRGARARVALLGSYATLGLFSVLPGKRLAVSAIDRAFRSEPERIRDLVQGLVDLLARKELAPHVGLELPLERAAEAHALLERGAVAGKIVLRAD